jgi:hypothetical protein
MRSPRDLKPRGQLRERGAVHPRRLRKHRFVVADS